MKRGRSKKILFASLNRCDKLFSLRKKEKEFTTEVANSSINMINLHNVSSNQLPVVSTNSSCCWGFLYKIRDKIIEIFRFLGKILSFPLRYLGSKTWSLPGLIFRFPIVTIKHLFWKNLPHTYAEDLFGKGYHRFGHPILSSEEVKPYVKYASANSALQTGLLSYIEDFGYKICHPKDVIDKLVDLPKELKAHQKCFFDSSTGLKIAIYKKENELLFSFGTLAGADSETTDITERIRIRNTLWNSGFASASGIKSSLFMDADAVFSKIKNLPDFKDKKIVVTGQCLGGTIASFLSLKHQCQGITFNTMPMGVGLQEEIGNDKLMDADNHLTHIIARSDYFADLPRIVGVADAILNFIGLNTPGNFGKKYLVPTAYDKAWDTHRFIVGSMMAHMGFHFRTLPGEVKHDPKAKGLF